MLSRTHPCFVEQIKKIRRHHEESDAYLIDEKCWRTDSIAKGQGKLTKEEEKIIEVKKDWNLLINSLKDKTRNMKYKGRRRSCEN